jgi:hypothetical protein
MAKLKLSVTLPPDLVALIDRAASGAPGGNRSAVIERWLREASRHEAQRALARATIDYYQSLSPEKRAEDEDWTRFSTAHVSWGDGAPSRAADSGTTRPVTGPRRRRRGQ